MKNPYPLSLVVAGACLTGAAGCTGSDAASTAATGASAATPPSVEARQVAEAAPQSRVAAPAHSAARTGAVPTAVNAAGSRPAPSTRGNQTRVSSTGTAGAVRMIRPTTRVEDAAENSRVEAPSAAGHASTGRIPSAPVSRRVDSAASRPPRLEPAPPANLSTPTEDADAEADEGESDDAGDDADGAGVVES